MAGLFLNKVKAEGDTGLKPPKAGKWKADADFLATYARVVEVQEELSVKDMARSVPSVFQRPLQFFQALEHRDNPLHVAVQSEWRGLLAAIALEQLLNAPIETKFFKVPEVGAEESSRVGNAEIGDLHFRAALRYQLPQRKLEKDASNGGPRAVSDFESWEMLRCQGELLGATSPWSMVYTAASYKAPRAIPWQDQEGKLIDPIAHFDPLRKGEKLENKHVALPMLYAWVSDLVKRSGSFGYEAALTQYKTVIVQQLEAWQAALAPYRNHDMRVNADSSRFSTAPFSNVLTYVAGIAGGDQESDVLIETRAGRRLLLSEFLAPHTRIYKGTFVAQIDIGKLPPEGLEFKTRGDKTIAQPFLHAEIFFFSRRLIRLPLAPGALQARTGQQQTSNVNTLALPIRPEFFRYFTHEQLQSWLTVEDRGLEGGAVATLHLPVVGGGSRAIRRVYGAGDVISVPDTPGFAVWPDAYDPDWNGNVAGYAASDKHLSVVPVFADGMAPDDTLKAAMPGPIAVRLWHCKNRPPLGFALSLLTDKGPAGTVTEAAGLVLRKSTRPPEREIVPERTWRVGVDFGTSSTTVMVDDLRRQAGVAALSRPAVAADDKP